MNEEVKNKKGHDGSLYAFMNHCRTAFGKRQFKRWLMSPLMDPVDINSRLDSVEDLMKCQFELEQVRVGMGKLPDLEKLLAKIFTYSVKHRVKAIFFEDVSLIKLREFRNLLNNLKSIPEIIKPLMGRKNEFKS